MRRVLATLLLTALISLQLAALALPTAIALAGRPAISPLQAWTQLIESPAPLAGLVAVAAALLLGVPAALSLWRRPGRAVACGVLLAPVLLPAALLAPQMQSDGAALLLAGHLSLGLALGTGCTLIGLNRIDRALLRAAAHAGISPAGAYRRLVLPLALPGILAGLLLSMTASCATSLINLAFQRPISLSSLANLPAASTLAATGVALLLSAATAAAFALLRRP